MFDLTNKTALITGAASGIGESIARTLAQAGAHVYITDVKRDEGKKVTDSIISSGARAAFLPSMSPTKNPATKSPNKS